MLTIRNKIAFSGYLLIALALLAVGIRYTIAGQIMPYHVEAIGTAWENLNPGTQVMTLNFMKSAAAGFITTAIAILFLLMFPFRKGEGWSKWALLSIVLAEEILIGFYTYNVKTLTPADPPLIAPFIVIAIAVISFFLSLNNNQSNYAKN